MICISVTPESRQLAKVDILNAARQSDMVEVCLDRLTKEPDVKDLLEGAKKPILISCRRPSEGGHYDGSDDDRTMLLRQAILAGPAYIELDIETARKIPRFGKVQRVVSYTSLDRPLTGNIDQIFDDAVAAKADVIKFTWPTQTLEAAWPLLAAVSQKRSLPVVGLGIGRCGLTFSLLGRKYGSPWIYAALEKGMEAFPGQPTVGELDDWYRWREVGPKTRFIGICGIGEMSVAMARVLNAAFDRAAMNMRCLPFDIRSTETLARMLDILKMPAVIALPAYGEALMALTHQTDDISRQTRYADLFLKQAEGWQAYNFLGRMALKTYEARLGDPSVNVSPLQRKNIMILGSGGLARSLALGVQKRNGLVSLCSGDDSAAQSAAQQTNSRFVPLGKVYDTLCDGVICTVRNFDHNSRKSPINTAILRQGMALMDLADLPAESPLMEEGRARGCKVIQSSDLFVDYISQLYQSLTGQTLPAEAFAAGLAEA